MQKLGKNAVLVIIDGWGIREEKKGNAIAMASTPNYKKILDAFPVCQLNASEHHVGLPDGVMGNSEVGHMNIGGGRRVLQDQVRIHEALDQDQIKDISAWKHMIESIKGTSRKLHFLCLVSQGNVHSSERHYLDFLSLAVRMGISPQQILFHAITDGRDTSPQSAAAYVQTLLDQLTSIGAELATISGRFYAMDRDKRWERSAQAFETIVHGKGPSFDSALDYIDASYQQGIFDEFLIPAVHSTWKNKTILRDGDAVFCANFRADRMRQIVRMLGHCEHGATIAPLDGAVSIVTMTEYDSTFPFPCLFEKQNLSMGLGEYISQLGLSQFRTAETEKYAHVTFFFNGGREEPFPCESRCLIPSPKVKTYDVCPAMSSEKVCEAVVAQVEKKQDALVVVNFAQPDMVGHTGVFEAALQAVESMDRAMGAIMDACLKSNYTLWITADHGNIEMMTDADGNIHTAHTLNPVPLILVDEQAKHRSLKHGSLSNIAPTLLAYMQLEAPKEMTSLSLLG
ncbi:MAG: 2,3-bisphosphoglycerate-independent phosphoglycerate mutase [Bdellovibrionota bacterium]